MRKRLSYINPWQVGKVQSILAVLFSLVGWLPIMCTKLAIHPVISRTAGQPGPPPWVDTFFILFPVIYAVLGFVFGVIFAAAYNLIAKWTGGIEFITVDVRADGAPSRLPPSI